MKILSSFVVLFLASFLTIVQLVQARKLDRLFTDNNNNNNVRAVPSWPGQFPLGDLVSPLTSGTAGTGYGAGAVNPGAQLPFGALRIGPDTSIGLEPLKLPFQSEGGYSWLDKYLECFSHTHVDGAGEAEWQNVGITMVRAESSTANPPVSTSVINNAGYKSKFRHETEVSKPGYYGVNLDTPNVFAEITATGTMSAMHRYYCTPDLNNMSSQEDCVLIMDFAHGSPRTHHLFNFSYSVPNVQVVNYVIATDGKSANFTVRIIDSGMFLKNAQPLGGINVAFQLNVEIENGDIIPAILDDVSFWQGGEFVPLNNNVYGNVTSRSSGVAIRIRNSAGPNGQPTSVVVRSGLTFLGYPWAYNNMKNDQYNMSRLPNLKSPWVTFQDATWNARTTWESIFQQFYIGGGVNTSQFTENLGVFYSAVWRVHLSPTDYTEVGGYYLGLDNVIHQKKNYPSERRFSDLSTWDTYRSSGSLWVLLNPGVSRDVTNSM